jgi:amidase
MSESAYKDGTRVSRRAFLAGLGTATVVRGREPALAAEQKMTDPAPLHYRTLVDVAAEIRGRKLSPVDLTQSMLARIDALEPRLHAYYTLSRDRALAAAEKAQREIAAGRYLGALHGVPIAVKDLCFTSGVRTTGGTGSRRDFVPTFDATVVRRL